MRQFVCSKRKEFLLSLLCFFATGNVNIASGFQSLSSGNVALLRYPLRSRRHANTELRVIQEDRSPERNNNAVPINNDEKEKWKEKSTKTEVSSEDKETPSESRNDDNLQQAKKDESRSPQPATRRKKMGLMWCAEQYCKDAARERVMGEHNQIILDGPATGQVAYYWRPASPSEKLSSSARNDTKEECYRDEPPITEPSVLLLVKPNDKDLLKVASDAVQSLTSEYEIHVSLDSNLAAKFKYHHGVDNDRIHLFEPRAIEGFGGSHVDAKDKLMHDFSGVPEDYEQSFDLICTLGGDGLLMHASMLFQGPVPPVISIAGGSLGFLTQFSKEEVVDAVRIALGQLKEELKTNGSTNSYIPEYELDNVFPPNMPSYPYPPLKEKSQQASDNTNSPKFTFGLGDRVCLSIRMRLECRIYNREGVLRARFNVLNEVVIDRGSSPYLANLECFCDDHHLTTVQADGVIFATPTGSTAYSMAAGGSVVHPAVPCILVTPICPHVLSFRSMVFPDHVVLRCFVPEDARADASVAFDGRYRRELHRGDSLQIQMSPYPVPTINRADHSSDWLGSLKRSFNFNTRPRQKPLL